MVGYSESDYASDYQRRSTTDSLANAAITWSSRNRKQQTTSLYTTEAEYNAASLSAKEAVWLRQILLDIDEAVDLDLPTFLWIIRIVQNPKFHKRYQRTVYISTEMQRSRYFYQSYDSRIFDIPLASFQRSSSIGD